MSTPIPIPKKLLISQDDTGLITVEEYRAPGSPYVGRGRTMMSAIGSWLHSNQTKLGIEFIVDPSAQALEQERRRDEESQR